MSAIPVGYEGVQSLRRKGVTLLCILLASSMAMGLLVYVDSYSVHEWDNQLSTVGPIAMIVESWEIQDLSSITSRVENIDGVTKVASIQTSYAQIYNPISEFENEYHHISVMANNEEYYEAFPGYFQLASGTFPENESEIMINVQMMQWADIEIGDIVNYTTGWNEWEQESVLLTVVGSFTMYNPYEYSNQYYYYYSYIEAIVNESLLYDDDIRHEIHIDVDRSPLTPFDSRGSYTYLTEIEESIRALDHNYNSPYGYSRYYVQNIIGNKVRQYMYWQTNMRISQVLRASGALLLVVLVMFLAIRHNVNERRYENNMLMARGASKGDVEKRIFKEIVTLSVLGSIIGLGLGILFSRFAIASTGFFEFDLTLIYTEPLLVSLESIIMAILVGFLLPVLSFLSYNAIFSTKRRAEEGTGRLSKLARGLAFIRWDILVLGLSILILILMSGAGTILQAIPFLGMIVGLTPLATFIALASLTVKFIRRTANPIAEKISRVVGEMPASVGVRRIGKSASSAGPAIIVLVLAMSLAWTNATIDASLPQTKVNQARFAFGGDVAFHLEPLTNEHWTNFTTNVTSHAIHEYSTLVSRLNLYLSAGYRGQVSVLAMNPTEYQRVGYDYRGIPLDSSAIGSMLDSMESNPTGIILTSDIADSYDVSVGDSLRAFAYAGEDVEQVFAFSIIGIVEALSDASYTDTGWESDSWWWYRYIGLNTMWVNKDYLNEQLTLVNNSESILCVRTQEGANSTELVEDIINAGGNTVIYSSEGWASVSYDVEGFLGQTSYQIDRAVDTMLTITTVAIIFGAFAIYAFEGVTARKREIALLRAMGAERNHVIKAQVAEMAVLMVIGLGLLLIYSPIHITNALLIYNTSTYIFPVSIFPVFPYSTMIAVLIFFIGAISIFILVVASLSTRISLSTSLNATWAESGPYGGDL